jgi:sec-independent protein translocase protein TatC
MPRQPSDEDLFKGSTMTFGEHLEELRACLFKAVVGLAIGFLLGLTVGGWVVTQIQTPLEKALTSYCQKQSEEKLRTDGHWLEAAPEGGGGLVAEGLLPELFYVEPSALVDQVQKAYPDRFDDLQVPTPADPKQLRASDLIPVLLWRRNEDNPRIRVTALNVHEAFTIWIKASLLVGVLLASPWIFYQIWSFVAAGLYPHEKKYIHVFLPFSLVLFLAGAGLAFFFVFEPVLTFLFRFNRMLGIPLDPRISEWLGFVMILPLGFGISFQLPLVMLFLERIGVMSIATYLSKIRIAILVIFVIAMFLTPADPYSMLLMAIPLTLLYYGGILLCRVMPRRTSRFEEG